MSNKNTYIFAMSAESDSGASCGIYLEKVKAKNLIEATTKANKYIKEYNENTDEGIQMYLEEIKQLENIQEINRS